MKKSTIPPETIEEVVQQGLCIFCGTCCSACPQGLISFSFETEYRIQIDRARCNSCSACLDVCPGLSAVRPGKKVPGNSEDYYIGEYSKIFSAYSLNFKQRYAGSSGGVVTQIAASLLADKIVDGAILTRFSPEIYLKPEAFIATRVEDILTAQGSKYSPVPVNSLLTQLDPSKKYAYVGLPCHLQGLDMYLKKFPGSTAGNFFKIGLFCSRTNTLSATKELLRLNKVNENEIESIRYRGCGHPGYFSATLKNGKQKRVRHLDPTYWEVLFKRYFVQYRCWLCPDKTALYADISCGDDWSRGLQEDRVGSSSVICRSPVALNYFEGLIAKGELAASPLQLAPLLSSQGLKRKMNIHKRRRIAAFFKLPLPQYPGYEFKKEPLPLRNELAMLVRIRLQGHKAMRWMMAGDFYFSPKIHALKKLLNFRRNFHFLWRIVPRKLWQIMKKFKQAILIFPGRPRSHATPDAAAVLRSPEACRANQFHIVICGGYGYQDIGDEAMPKALIANLKKGISEGLILTMLSPNPEYTHRYHGQRAIRDIIFFSSKEDTSGLNGEMERYLRWTREYTRQRNRLFLKLLLRQRRDFYHILKAISQGDALLNVGGGNINSMIRHELYKKCTLHRITHMLGKPVFISGQTIGPFDNDNDRALARESLELASVLTFRDRRTSAGRVAELGVQGPLMYDAGDDALSLSCISKTEAQELIAADAGKKWFEFAASAIWGINLKGSLNVFKGKGRSGNLANEIDLMTQICEYLLKNHQAKILLVSTDFCPGVDDRLLLHRLHQQIDPTLRQRVAVLENSYNDHQLKGITGCCDFILGSRYHFLVFALSGNIPAIGIASGLYQQTKLSGVLGLLDLSEYFVPLDMEYATAAEVFPFIDRIVKNRESIKEMLRQKIPTLTAKSIEIVAHIRSRLHVR